LPSTALLVREHRPEPAQGLRGDARTELRDVALQVRADEVRAPAKTRGVGRGEQAFWETAPQPERVETFAANLTRIERAELEIADASRERLAGLLEQVYRRGADDEETALPAPATPAFVDEAAEHAEELRGALDLIEDDELVVVLREIELRLGQLRAVAFGFEIEVEGRPILGDLESQRGLAGLSRTEQRHGRRFCEGGAEVCQEEPVDHPCNYGVPLQQCKDAASG
jgi:hypothetical protein